MILMQVVIGVIGILLGLKIGFEYLAIDLHKSNRLTKEEVKHITSNKYFWRIFKFFDNDK